MLLALNDVRRLIVLWQYRHCTVKKKKSIVKPDHSNDDDSNNEIKTKIVRLKVDPRPVWSRNNNNDNIIISDKSNSVVITSLSLYKSIVSFRHSLDYIMCVANEVSDNRYERIALQLAAILVETKTKK